MGERMNAIPPEAMGFDAKKQKALVEKGLEELRKKNAAEEASDIARPVFERGWAKETFMDATDPDIEDKEGPSDATKH